MTFVLFLLYMAAGGGAGYATWSMLGLDLPLSIGAGVATTAVLGQIHVLISNAGNRKKMD